MEVISNLLKWSQSRIMFKSKIKIISQISG